MAKLKNNMPRPRVEKEKITSKWTMTLRDPSNHRMSSKLNDTVPPKPTTGLVYADREQEQPFIGHKVQKTERTRAILDAMGNAEGGKQKKNKLDSIKTSPERKKKKEEALLPTMSSPRKSGKQNPKTTDKFVVQPRVTDATTLANTLSPTDPIPDTTVANTLPPTDPIPDTTTADPHETLPLIEPPQLPPAPPIGPSHSVPDTDPRPPRSVKKNKATTSEPENTRPSKHQRLDSILDATAPVLNDTTVYKSPCTKTVGRKAPPASVEDSDDDPDFDPDQPDPGAPEFEHSDTSKDDAADDEDSEDDVNAEEDNGIDLSSIPSIRCKSRGYAMEGNSIVSL